MSLVTIQAGKGVSVVKLNRSEKRNALNVPLLQELLKALESAKEARVLILHGEGPVFCAGMDLKERRGEELIAQALTRLYCMPCVTIAAVQGAAIAGGAGLMAACDLAVGHEDALFGFPEVRRGLVAALVMSCLIRKLLPQDIRELTLLGELIDANRAHRMGLLNRVVEGEVLPEAFEMAEQVLLGAPRAIKETKRLMQQLEPRSFEEDIQAALAYHKKAIHSEEAKEGIKSFLEGKAPSW